MMSPTSPKKSTEKIPAAFRGAWYLGGLATLLLALLLGAAPVSAAPTHDSDGDGVDDDKELAGFVGPELGGPDAFTLGPCPPGAPLALDCTDVAVKNVYVEVVLANPSAVNDYGISLETDVYQAIENGLQIRVTPVPTVPTMPPTLNRNVCDPFPADTDDRCVTRAPSGRNQHPRWAVLTENRTIGVSCPNAPMGELPTNIPVYGSASGGNIGEFGDATFFSRVMEEHMGCVFTAKGDTNPFDHFLRDQIVWAEIHELLHVMYLAPDRDEIIGPHFPASNKCWLDQNTTYKVAKKNGTVTWNVPDAFCRASTNAIEDGFTSLGSTHCGDFTDYDGDGFEFCAPAVP